MGSNLIFIKWILWNWTVLDNLCIILQILKLFRLDHCIRNSCLGFRECPALWTGLRTWRRISWSCRWESADLLFQFIGLFFRRFSGGWRCFFRDEIALAEEKRVCGPFAYKEERFRRFLLLIESMCNRCQKDYPHEEPGAWFPALIIPWGGHVKGWRKDLVWVGGRDFIPFYLWHVSCIKC